MLELGWENYTMGAEAINWKVIPNLKNKTLTYQNNNTQYGIEKNQVAIFFASYHLFFYQYTDVLLPHLTISPQYHAQTSGCLGPTPMKRFDGIPPDPPPSTHSRTPLVGLFCLIYDWCIHTFAVRSRVSFFLSKNGTPWHSFFPPLPFFLFL